MRLSGTSKPEYESRKGSADLDCLEVCPAIPDYMLYGTYSLVKKGEAEYPSQVRKGSIETIPFLPTPRQLFTGSLTPKLMTTNVPAAVLDLHFHPDDHTLLAVALSNTEIRFYRFITGADILTRRVTTELLPLGYISTSGRDESGCLPLVTQFQWLSIYSSTGRKDVSNHLTTALICTLSSGHVKRVRVAIPGIRTICDPRLSQNPPQLDCEIQDIHRHSLEAWCCTSVTLTQTASSLTSLVFSGADDGGLVGSIIHTSRSSEFPANAPDVNLEVQHLYTDPKTHTAGIISLLPLPAEVPASHISLDNPSNRHPPFPLALLTGSYDDFLRLFSLDCESRVPDKLLASHNFEGGAWRLKLFSQYRIPLSTSPAQQPPVRGSLYKPYQQHWLILVSCMYEGAIIVRITHTENLAPEQAWTIEQEHRFVKGHETIVYACDIRRAWVFKDEEAKAKTEAKKKRESLKEEEKLEASLAKMSVKGREKDGGKADKADQEKEKDKKKAKKEKSSPVGLYRAVSTSYYDRAICNWEWRDEVRAGAREVDFNGQ